MSIAASTLALWCIAVASLVLGCVSLVLVLIVLKRQEQTAEWQKGVERQLGRLDGK